MRIRGIPLGSLARLLRLSDSEPGPLRVCICVADHFEPKWRRAPSHIQRERVARWVDGYPRSVDGLADSLGRSPQHTFFYPQDEYEPEFLDRLAVLRDRRLGDVEVHLHHDNDTSDGVREKLSTFASDLMHRHGLLRPDAVGRPAYGFIHGNWSLDNSRPDGRWCGVNDELTILRETGCYADFTMPSAPDSCQTATVNQIYYATDDPTRPKSHDTGVAAQVGVERPADSLLMVQGPLALDWRRRKAGMLPGVENGDLTGRRPPTSARFHLWLRANVCVQGRQNWRFVKLHTHGAQESNAAMLLGPEMRSFHESLADWATKGDGLEYYYVTAFEMAQLVHCLERSAVDDEALDMLSAKPTIPN